MIINMKRRLFRHFIVASIVVASPATGQAVQKQSPPRIVHHFTPKSTIVEQGDTITWIHTTPADSLHKASQTVLVYLFRPDTVIMLGKYGPRPVDPFLAKELRHLVMYAREQDELEKKLGRPLH